MIRVRRTRAEMRLRRFVAIGQHWRRRSDDTVWRVRQVIRADCVVELEDGHDRLWLGFADLRSDYRWIAETPKAAAA